MKKLTKQNYLNLGVSTLLILKGIVIIILPLFKINDPYIILSGAFLFYFILKISEYFIVRKKEYLNDLYTALLSFIMFFVVMYIAKYNAPIYLALSLFAWIGIKLLIKIIKLDFFHDRSHNMFYVNLFTSVMFALTGILSSLYLYLSNDVTTVVIGFFFLINGILNIVEDSFRILIK